MLSINEAVFNNSVVSVIKGRALNRVGKTDLTSEDKIDKQNEISKRLTPTPNSGTKEDEKKLGFKKIRPLKHPQFLV
jgi:hypothetical protein